MAGAVSEFARCSECQATIDRLRARGYTYSAMQFNSWPWEAVFLGPNTARATGSTLHEAIAAAARAVDQQS